MDSEFESVELHISHHKKSRDFRSKIPRRVAIGDGPTIKRCEMVKKKAGGNVRNWARDFLAGSAPQAFSSTPAMTKKDVEDKYLEALIDDGQEEGGFNLSHIRSLPACSEGWVVSYSTTGEVDETTGALIYVCVCRLHDPAPPLPPTGEDPWIGTIGVRFFSRRPTGMDATIVLDNAMFRPMTGTPRRPQWILVPHRFGNEDFKEIQGQMIFRHVLECWLQPLHSAMESCVKFGTDVNGQNFVKSKKNIMCASCGRKEDMKKQLKKCSGCRQVHYCCTTCQKNDWKEHKGLCKQVQKNALNEDKENGDPVETDL